MSKTLPETIAPEEMIIRVRGHAVILDAELAKLYGVKTGRLNEQVKRNIERFPEDFMFQLSWEEARRSRSQNATLKKGKNVKYRPYAFTEHGAVMAANVLKSKEAIQMSVAVVRAFVKMRRMALSVEGVARKLNAMESKYDKQFGVVFKAIRQLMASPPPSPGKKIKGFKED